MKTISKIAITIITIFFSIFLLSSCSNKHILFEYSNSTDMTKPTNNKLSILSYNLGLLRIKIPFRSDWEFTPHLEERLEYVSESLISKDADIIVLQEIYSLKHQDILIEQLKHNYPYSSRSGIKRSFSLNADGLLTFSKFPILSGSFTRFESTPLIEKIVVIKGYLSTRINIDSNTSVTLINTHLTAGGLLEPESKKADIIRSREIKELQNIRIRDTSSTNFVLAGDFNTGTKPRDKDGNTFVSKNNFELLTSNGWTSAYDSILSNQDLDDYTWSIDNPLNSASPHASSPSQRIDHVVLGPRASKIFTVESANIVFKEKIVSIPDKPNITVSDHYGLLVNLNIN